MYFSRYVGHVTGVLAKVGFGAGCCFERAIKAEMQWRRLYREQGRHVPPLLQKAGHGGRAP